MTAAATDEQWAERAAVYLSAERKPLLALMQTYAVPHTTAAMWAYRLRERGLIPSYGKGRSTPPVTITVECECGWRYRTQTVGLTSVIAQHRRDHQP